MMVSSYPEKWRLHHQGCPHHLQAADKAVGGTGGDQAGAVVEEEAEDGTPAALGRLVARLEARAWKAHMSALHSLLLLLDLALSSDAAAHRGRASVASPTP